MILNGELKKHPCGIYFQNMATDPVTGVAAIPYKEAEEFGFFKIDFLHLSVLDKFTSKKQIKEYLNKEPNWTLLKKKEVVDTLFHLKNWYDVLNTLEPKSIPDIADCLALIRPNKQHLLHEYITNKERARTKLYKIDKGDKTSFKKSHATAYAMVIVLQLHLIERNL